MLICDRRKYKKFKWKLIITVGLSMSGKIYVKEKHKSNLIGILKPRKSIYINNAYGSIYQYSFNCIGNMRKQVFCLSPNNNDFIEKCIIKNNSEFYMNMPAYIIFNSKEEMIKWKLKT